MEVEFRLPSLGADMEAATLTHWLKKPGDAVHRGEAIAVVETDKGLIDIECFEDGVVSALTVEPGTRIPVGTVLARLASETAPAVPAPAAPISAAPPSPPPLVKPAAPAGPAPATAATVPGRAHISPAARRRAVELGVSLEELQGQGGVDIIHIEDVERVAALSKASSSDPRAAMRIAIGNAMTRAKREIPHYYLQQAVDVSPTREWLSAHNAKLPVAKRLLEGLLIVKAVAMAAARSAEFNGYFRNGRFESAVSVHVGTAIALRGGGLVAPALLDADKKDLQTLMQEFSDLVSRVRAGHMRSSEFAAATITVTSLGDEGADSLYPIINPPQVAIVGAGCIAPQPWVHEGAVMIRPVLSLTLAADHRVTDGRSGSRFLKMIGELLATPDKL